MKRMLEDGGADQVGMLPERVELVRELCAGWVESGHTPTLGVCVARRGTVVLDEAFGVLGPGPDSEPLRGDALFPGMSITKPITATLIMQLVEDQGRSNLLVRVLADNLNISFYEHLGARVVGHQAYDWEGYATSEVVLVWDDLNT